MADFNTSYQPSFYLSPDQEDALLTALSSNTPAENSGRQDQSRFGSESKLSRQSLQHGQLDQSPQLQAPGSGHFEFGTDPSPFLDFDLDVDFDAEDAERLIGDLPDMSPPGEMESREKRKSMDGKTEDDEGGRKRRESEVSKKPGRKPLTAEPTSKRKAQNRAAQRAFRERKEKHLKDLETKVEDLERESQSTNHENSRLRAQVERLQVELREYRKRLSWVSSGNGISPSLGNIPNAQKSRNQSGLNNNDFNFEFPKFGDLPGAHIFNNGSLTAARNNNKAQQRSQTSSTADYRNPNSMGASSNEAKQNVQAANTGSRTNSPGTNGKPYDELLGRQARGNSALNADNLQGFLGNSSHTSFSSHRNSASHPSDTTGTDKINTSGFRTQGYGTSTVSNTDSPSASSESQQTHMSSIGTSPEPSFNSPSTGKPSDLGLNTINEEKAGRGHIEGEKSFCDKLSEACGNIKNPVPVAMSTPNNNGDVRAPGQNYNAGTDFDGIDWFSQQNGGQFDPVLFGEYRDTQDAILSQDFGTFFDDAFPLPDLGSPYNDLQGGKRDPLIKPDEDEEVVPGDDKSQMMTCTKIWDRLQSMDKFRNGEIDVDNLCTELRTKARCSEGGVVVDQKDVDDIMGRAH